MSEKLLLGTDWVEAHSGRIDEIRSPYSGEVVSAVALADAVDARHALDAAEHGAEVWRRTPAHERMAIISRAADLMDERQDELARLITAEMGKSLTEARGEAGRQGAIARMSGHEGTMLYGESLPLDANPGTGHDKIGFTVRQPCGIVVAITPFNYPALLVMHKVGPALAAGNAVVLKPASATPLTALHLAQCYVDAGLPAGVLSVLPGPGREIGDALVSDPRVRKISFTGSTSVGEHLTAIAGVKKLSLELGASCPALVLPGADINAAVDSIVKGAFTNAGQVCISVQRLVVHRDLYGDVLDALTARARSVTAGDPSDTGNIIGSLVSTDEAKRVESALRSSADEGARLELGGEREGAVIQPAILSGVETSSPIAQQELFGPAVAVSVADSVDDAIGLANASSYGLGSGVFTNDMNTALRCIREIDSGTVHINWTPLWRADLMPYGGLKGSGIGKEGFRSAVEEMTESKTAILHSL